MAMAVRSGQMNIECLTQNVCEIWTVRASVVIPLLEECEDDIHTFEMGMPQPYFGQVWG
jgi:hypothetical protein